MNVRKREHQPSPTQAVSQDAAEQWSDDTGDAVSHTKHPSEHGTFRGGCSEADDDVASGGHTGGAEARNGTPDDQHY